MYGIFKSRKCCSVYNKRGLFHFLRYFSPSNPVASLHLMFCTVYLFQLKARATLRGSLTVRNVSSELVQTYSLTIPPLYSPFAVVQDTSSPAYPPVVLTGSTCSSCNLHCKSLSSPCQIVCFPLNTMTLVP